MKVGLSLSRCVRDIFEKRVQLKEVLVVISRTDFDPEDDKQWNSIWTGYAGDNSIGSVWSHPEWHGYKDNEQEFRNICINLKKSGQLHQPRQFGAFPPRLDYYWYDVIISPADLANNPAAEEAWNTYKIAAKLGSAKTQNLIFDNNF
jgi:hypothetical protein